MAILKALRVSEVSELRAEASKFHTHADELKGKTDQMLQLVESTQQVWRGAARDRYYTQFEGLRDDMQRIYEMCVEYSTDLQTIADNYQAAEDDNISKAGSLKADIELH